MISVIVPVYDVEPYLRKCLDSIVGQTFGDLEILLIDDGSTDGSGRICDEYANADSRIRVFHTENKGISAARNLGLDTAGGEWIGFVDSDDWLEADMYEYLMKKAEETEADIVECGVFLDYPHVTMEEKKKALTLTGKEAIRKLLEGELSTVVWNKLYRKACFSAIAFPPGRVYEDLGTTYRVFANAEKVCTAEDCKYHYNRRTGSASTTQTMKNLTGYWLSNKDRYDYFVDQGMEEETGMQLRLCARAATRTWALYCDCAKSDRKAHDGVVRDMNRFIRQNVPLFGLKEWGKAARIGVLFPHFNNMLSFWSAWLSFKMVKKTLRLIKWQNNKTEKEILKSLLGSAEEYLLVERNR